MLTTERLLLRPWRETDCMPFAAMNADPDVMRYFPHVYDREQSDGSVDRFIQHIDEHGFGFWVAEVRATNRFVGFIGMQHVADALPCAPAVEIGWRLDKSVWGQGLAPEGARACLAYGFSRLGLDEIVSFTATANKPSARVMEKIGMTRDVSRDFDHPFVEDGSPLKPHVFYAIRARDPMTI